MKHVPVLVVAMLSMVIASAMPSAVAAQSLCTVCEDNYNLLKHFLSDQAFAIYGTGDPAHPWYDGTCVFLHDDDYPCWTEEEEEKEAFDLLQDLDQQSAEVVVSLLKRVPDHLSFNQTRGVVQVRACESDDIVDQYHLSAGVAMKVGRMLRSDQ